MLNREEPTHAIRIAPATGEVVDPGKCCSPGRRGHARAGCCGRDLGPMETHEEPSEEDIERFSGVTRDCPHCGKEISDEADQCHFCGESEDAGPRRPIPKWTAVAVVLVIIAFAAAYVFRGSLF